MFLFFAGWMKLSLSSLKDLVEGLENRGQLDDSVRLVSQGVLDIPLHGPHLPHSPILLQLLHLLHGWHRQILDDEHLEAFANLVAAHKAEVALAEAYRCGYAAGMEAAAVICENLPMQQEVDVRDECAAAIRERGET